MLLLGGTFDPPHLGHLLLAECARVELCEERVVFVPAGDPWRKTLPGAVAAAVPSRQVTPARQRLAMLRLAVRGNPAFSVDDREVRRKGPSYTSETLSELQAEGVTDVTLLLGSDAVADMRYWHEPSRILEMARVAAVVKPGGMPVAEAVRALEGVVLGLRGGWWRWGRCRRWRSRRRLSGSGWRRGCRFGTWCRTRWSGTSGSGGCMP
ncbi:MAG: nicotinate-nucleotide adenylyltransferase [Dehalococcoidia bacterium]